MFFQTPSHPQRARVSRLDCKAARAWMTRRRRGWWRPSLPSSSSSASASERTTTPPRRHAPPSGKRSQRCAPYRSQHGPKSYQSAHSRVAMLFATIWQAIASRLACAQLPKLKKLAVRFADDGWEPSWQHAMLDHLRGWSVAWIPTRAPRTAQAFIEPR